MSTSRTEYMVDRVSECVIVSRSRLLIARPPEADRVPDPLARRDHERLTTADYHQGSFPPLTRLSSPLRSKPQVFRKYSHALGPDALDFLEDALDKHEIRDEDVEYSVDLIAKEYNKQDGQSEAYDASGPRSDSTAIRRSYESFGHRPAKGVPTLAGVIYYRKFDRAGYP